MKLSEAVTSGWPLLRAVTERGRAGEPKEPGQTLCVFEGSLFYEGSGLEQVVCELLQGAVNCSNPAISGPRVSTGTATLLVTRTAQVGSASNGTGHLWCVKRGGTRE